MPLKKAKAPGLGVLDNVTKGVAKATELATAGAVEAFCKLPGVTLSKPQVIILPPALPLSFSLSISSSPLPSCCDGIGSDLDVRPQLKLDPAWIGVHYSSRSEELGSLDTSR